MDDAIVNHPRFWRWHAGSRGLLELTQCCTDVRGSLDTPLAIVFQAAGDEALEGSGLDLSTRSGDAADARRHFREHKSESEEIGTRVQRLTRSLFRSHVSGSADDHAVAGQWLLPSDVARQLGQPEIKDLRVLCPCEEQIARLDVAVNDACRVGGLQTIDDFQRQRNEVPLIERAALQTLPQRFAFQILHDDERSTVVVAEVVDGADVRVAEGGRGPCLTPESDQGVGRVRGRAAQELHRDEAIQAGIDGFIDDAHATVGDPLDES